MPSRILRRSAAGTWIEVADFDELTLAPNTAWGIWKRGTLLIGGGGHADIPAAGQPFNPVIIAQMTTTLVPGRLYRLSMFIRAVAPADGSGEVWFVQNVTINGVAQQPNLGDPWMRMRENYDSSLVQWVFPTAKIGTTADTVIGVQLHNHSDQVLRVWMDSASYLILEDVGPDRG